MKQSRLRPVERGNRFEGLAPEDISASEVASCAECVRGRKRQTPSAIPFRTFARQTRAMR